MKHFCPKPLIFKGLFKHTFGAVPPGQDVSRMTEDFLERYDAERVSDVEDYVWPRTKKTYAALIGTDACDYIFKVQAGSAAASLQDNEFLLVEASAEGRRALTTYKDNPMHYETLIPRSYTAEGCHLPSRRIAACRPSPLPDVLRDALTEMGEDTSSFFSVTENPKIFKTQKLLWKHRGPGHIEQQPESGWGMIRDRARFMVIDCRPAYNLDHVGQLLSGFIKGSQADYLLSETVPGYSLKHQMRHLDELADLAEEDRVLLNIMRDPIAYNAEHTAIPIEIGEVDHLTPSQQEAATLIREGVCTIVRGPPGTGKTEFISSMILAMRGGPQSRGAMMVGVTAHQRAGISTLIKRVATRADAREVAVIAVGSSMETWR
jgi:hypothetical protein